MTFLSRYFDEIKNPMDFGTMGTKVKEGRYTTMEEFDKDAKLVFGNCKTFNPPTTAPHSWAEVVEKVYRREWAKAMEKKLAPSDKRALLSLVNNLVKDPMCAIFFACRQLCCSFSHLYQILGLPRTSGSNRTWRPAVLRCHTQAYRPGSQNDSTKAGSGQV